jgi:DNA-binding CsgD family transcriptional regulator
MAAVVARSDMDSGFFERLARDAPACANLQAFRTHILCAVQREVGAESAALVDPPGSPARSGRTGYVGLAARYALAYERERERYDRSIHRLMAAIESGPIIDGDLYTIRERERLALYDEILFPQGTRSILASMVHYHGRVVAQIVLKRHGSSRPFCPKDVTILRRMLPAMALADAGYQFVAGCKPPDTRASYGTLSPRETQVVELACKGMHNREIATLLGTSRETVKKQVQSAFEKVGVCNRTELAMVWAQPSQK